MSSSRSKVSYNKDVLIEDILIKTRELQATDLVNEDGEYYSTKESNINNSLV